MWGLFRHSAKAEMCLIRPYSLKTPKLALTPSELRFKEKLEEADKRRLKNAPEWEKRDHSLRKRYGEWNPTHKLSRQQMNDIRDLKARAPELKTVQIADFFNINPESIRRILKSRWQPSEEELAKQAERGAKRKAESLQRKLAAKEQARLLAKEGKQANTEKGETQEAEGLRVTQDPPLSSFLKTPGAPVHLKKHKLMAQMKGHGKWATAATGGSHRSPRKNKTPFTQGVGDLIE